MDARAFPTIVRDWSMDDLGVKGEVWVLDEKSNVTYGSGHDKRCDFLFSGDIQRSHSASQHWPNWGRHGALSKRFIAESQRREYHRVAWRVAAQIKEPAMAEKFLRRAIELAPNFAKPQEDLGVLLFHSGRVQESIGLLENACVWIPPRKMAGWRADGPGSLG